jgi:NADPH:quinone reductase
MRAVGVFEFGGPDSLEVVELPDPVAGVGQVRVRVWAAAVNPTDTFHTTGARAEMLSKEPPPYVPGMDVAGVIDQAGEGVTQFAVGDQVMGIVIPHGQHGGYSEKIVLPVESVARMPKDVTFAEAASLPMNGLTAQLTLDLLDLPVGATLAVTGAAGAYGGYVVQLAKAAGLTVIADASDADQVLVHSLGADFVVPRGPEVAAAIRMIVPDGVDAIADGSVQEAAVLPAVRDGGKFASVRGFQGEMERDITHHQVWVREYWRAQVQLDRLGRLVEEGALTLRVARTFGPEEASEAHKLLAAGGVRGRLVLEF